MWSRYINRKWGERKRREKRWKYESRHSQLEKSNGRSSGSSSWKREIEWRTIIESTRGLWNRRMYIWSR